MDTTTTHIYTLSLHDALPILAQGGGFDERYEKKPTNAPVQNEADNGLKNTRGTGALVGRSEEHTSELQSQSNLVCRLLPEKKKQIWSSGKEVPIYTSVQQGIM